MPAGSRVLFSMALKLAPFALVALNRLLISLTAASGSLAWSSQTLAAMVAIFWISGTPSRMGCRLCSLAPLEP